MQHLEGIGTPVLYIGHTVLKTKPRSVSKLQINVYFLHVRFRSPDRAPITLLPVENYIEEEL
jgi:hypothetical protein